MAASGQPGGRLEDLMREIVLDTETTGLDPDQGHRIVEVACIELDNHLPTGEHFHSYVNPQRDMPEDARRIHGLSEDFLRQHPSFTEIAEALVGFLGDSPLIIHNAAFDLKFLNAELAAVDLEPLAADRAVDTLDLARRKFPGAQNSLDALCRRFAIDNSARTRHGALLDAELLAEVYLELIGGRQPDLALARAQQPGRRQATIARPPRAHQPDDGERAAHEAFIATLNDPIWSH